MCDPFFHAHDPIGRFIFELILEDQQWTSCEWASLASVVLRTCTTLGYKDNPNVDAVEVITPHRLHAEMTIYAPQAGKHVSVEKPMSLNLT